MEFEIDALEVWGCGGAEVVGQALRARAEERDAMEETIRRAQKVDKAAFFNNEFDREFFLSKTTGHGGGASKRSGNA